MTRQIYTNRTELEQLGGLYIETTKSFDWMLGDKTRQFERVDDLNEVRRRLGLELNVDYKADSVHVQVADPNLVSRMFLSKNDSVSSLIGYAKIKSRYGDKPGHIGDLVASAGQHIIIEPFKGRNEIRLRVYPIKQ